MIGEYDMWYYIFMGFIMVCGYIVSRLNTPYHHDMLFKRHINIKNPKLQKLFIWQSDPFGGHNDNQKAYRGKLTIHGICFYIAWAFVLIFSVVFLIWGPTTSIEPIAFEEALVCTTLNKAAVLMLNFVFLGFGFSFYSLNIVRCRDVKINKFVNVLWWLVVIGLWSISIAAVVEFIKLII